MSDVVISVENLSKRYVLDHRGAARGGLRHVLQEKLTAPFRRRAGSQRNHSSNPRPLSDGHASREEFWALKDVSFEIKRGEVVGIIGRNGAGKSTLLKILSRITEPTSGRITLEGRVASLLEVGTGFHPELTGRENIYMNGAILGMSRAEIRSKFNEIVAFAEIEKFLDTPVKRYSSGMYVRLAFAVAAHLDPEILVVDEVLAVGDAQFQAKCLGKMQEVAQRDGRTILFVSHQMDAIQRLTYQCIWLGAGRVLKRGDTRDITGQYLASHVIAQAELEAFRDRKIAGSVTFDGVWLESTTRQRIDSVQQGEEFYICLTLNPEEEITANVGVVIENERQQALFATHLSDVVELELITKPTTYRILLRPAILRSGNYSVSLAAFAPTGAEFYDVILHFPLFIISGSQCLDFPTDSRWGNLYLRLPWERSA